MNRGARAILTCIGVTVCILGSPGVQRAAYAHRATQTLPYLKQVVYDNVAFTYGSSLARVVAGSYYAAHDELGETLGPSIQFTFSQYIVRGPAGANLSVYPLTAPYPVAPSVHAAAHALEVLLQARPSLANSPFLPFAPRIEAAEAFIARPAYLRFRNGRGIAYLTGWTQAPVVISNDMPVEFVVVGITDDRRFFISAEFPLRVPGLPAHQPAQHTFPLHYEAYIQGVVKKLDALQDAQFLPNLQYLRLLATSLDAHPSLIPPATVTLYVAGGSYGYTGANLRAAPSRQAAILTLIPNGTAVQVAPTPVQDAQGEAWNRVTYRGQRGYVLASLLSRMAP